MMTFGEYFREVGQVLIARFDWPVEQVDQLFGSAPGSDYDPRWLTVVYRYYRRFVDAGLCAREIHKGRVPLTEQTIEQRVMAMDVDDVYECLTQLAMAVVGEAMFVSSPQEVLETWDLASPALSPVEAEADHEKALEALWNSTEPAAEGDDGPRFDEEGEEVL